MVDGDVFRMSKAADAAEVAAARVAVAVCSKQHIVNSRYYCA